MTAPEVTWSDYNEDVLAELGPTFGGRRLLLRDVPVQAGTVAYWGNDSEATVVDPGECPDPYDQFYEEVRDRVMLRGIVGSWRVFRCVNVAVGAMTTTKKRFRTDVTRIARELGGHETLPTGYLINLGTLLERHTGLLCRHGAALGGYALDRFMQEGYIPKGLISIDANFAKAEGEGEAHAWLRYVFNEDGRQRKWISDAPRGVCGPLEEVATLEGMWPYARPDDVLAGNDL